MVGDEFRISQHLGVIPLERVQHGEKPGSRL